MSTPKITIGLDVGERFVELCVVDVDGAVLERGRLPTRLAALEVRFACLPRSRVVLETGKHSPWVSRALESWGHEVIVANARRVYLISRSLGKSDQADAETLARLGRVDSKLLRPVTHRGAQTQADLALLRAREALVRSRTLQINHTRHVVGSFGGALPKCSAESFPRKASEAIPAELAGALKPLLEMIEALTQKIRVLEREIERVSQERYPETTRLRQVPGVGPITALAYVLVLEDPRRYRTARSVGAYLGLVPKRRGSGESDPQLRITKSGDRMLRCLLVQAAHYILGPFGPESDLRQYGLAICARGGANAKKRAVVAVARKLSVLLYALWTSGSPYEPLRRGARAA
jgi:transposase